MPETTLLVPGCGTTRITYVSDNTFVINPVASPAYQVVYYDGIYTVGLYSSLGVEPNIELRIGDSLLNYMSNEYVAMSLDAAIFHINKRMYGA